MPSSLMSRASQSMRQVLQKQRNVGTRERWLSLLGGSLSLAESVRRHDALGVLFALLGGFLLFRGLSGHCPVFQQMHRNTRRPDEGGLLGERLIHARSRSIVQQPRDVVYRHWRDMDQLPQVMRHIRSIEVDGNRSRWTAYTELGQRLQWDAQITHDTPNERLAWRSVPGSQVETKGEIRFRPHVSGGTEIDIDLYYRLPGGPIARLLATLLDGLSERLLYHDLEQFKVYIESSASSGQIGAYPH